MCKIIHMFIYGHIYVDKCNHVLVASSFHFILNFSLSRLSFLQCLRKMQHPDVKSYNCQAFLILTKLLVTGMNVGD